MEKHHIYVGLHSKTVANYTNSEYILKTLSVFKSQKTHNKNINLFLSSI